MSGESRQGRSGDRGRSRPRKGRRSRKRLMGGCGPRCVGRQSTPISYKQVEFLGQYLSKHAKIKPRRQTGNCAKHQRQLARAIKRARYMALLPFSSAHRFTSRG